MNSSLIQNIIRNIFIITLVVLNIMSCSKNESGDTIAPTLMSATPSDGSSNIDITTTSAVRLLFTEKINLMKTGTITLNSQSIQASVENRTLVIPVSLTGNTDYTLHIPANTLTDDAGNAVAEINIRFRTAQSTTVDGTIYEAEKATLTGDASVASSTSAYSGTGYVNTNTGNVSFSINTATTGYYNLYFRYIATSDKTNLLYIDGVYAADISFLTSSGWTEIKAAMLLLTAGTHTISLVKSWGYIQLDYIRLASNTTGPTAFNIASSPVNSNASTQALNLYNYLKNNFGTKIISATMANYSTNITEATWVHSNTGKWPALTCFDFVNHTWTNQNWVEYSAPFALGQDWWNNNGIVACMWHWRDPLTKSGSFYVYSSSHTDGTTFDVSKISDTSSAEYKAIIVDIDVIAGYLKQFRDANIPVIWRPLHEAEGAWFWWGAKGADSFKTLWKLLYDRLVNYHGLNNLIWVYTSGATSNSANWYPGDSYVDIVGMDIYPGENQHGSQYISFNKVREITAGKKMITLSECGSVPDPEQMLKYGDTWSWFMPWNGDYTEASSHNGATWWNKFFGYSYVVSRDQMPSLK